jgi:hypothetical protein
VSGPTIAVNRDRIPAGPRFRGPGHPTVPSPNTRPGATATLAHRAPDAQADAGLRLIGHAPTPTTIAAPRTVMSRSLGTSCRPLRSSAQSQAPTPKPCGRFGRRAVRRARLLRSSHCGSIRITTARLRDGQELRGGFRGPLTSMIPPSSARMYFPCWWPLTYPAAWRFSGALIHFVPLGACMCQRIRVISQRV